MKHKKPIVWVYNTYGEDIAASTPDGKTVALPPIGKVAAAATKWPDSVGASFDLDALLRLSAQFGWPHVQPLRSAGL